MSNIQSKIYSGHTQIQIFFDIRYYLYILLLILPYLSFAAAPFSLVDSGPSHPDFKKRFLGVYGVLSKLEPSVSQKDRPLYQKVMPYLEQPQRAIQILNSELKREHNAVFDFLLGSLYFQNDDFDLAQSSLKEAIRKHPSFRRAYRVLALVSFKKGDYRSAIPALLKTISLGGADGQSYGLLAYAYLNQESYYSALEAYQQCRIFRPNSKDVQMGLAHCLIHTQQYGQAIALLDEMIQKDPSKTDLWLLQCNAFLSTEQHDRAMINLEIVRRMGRAKFKSLILLSKLYFNQDLFHLGLDSCLEAIRLRNQVEFQSIETPLSYLINREQWSSAQRLLAALPSSFEYHLKEEQKAHFKTIKASLFFGKGQKDDAVQLLKSIIQGNPMYGKALLLLGRYLLELNKIEDAEFYLERAIHIQTYSHEAHLELGRLFVIKGDFNQSLTHLYRAQQIKKSVELQSYIQHVESAHRATHSDL